MNTRQHTWVWIICVILLALPFTHALAETPPSGLDATLKEIIEKGYVVALNNRGWGETYDLPQSEFSVDDLDFYDNSAEFAGVGLFVLGLQHLTNPQLADLGLDQNISTHITQTAQSTQRWVWTPNDVTFGVHHGGRLDNNGITRVTSQVMGINGTSNACMEEAAISYNTWATPKDTITKQTLSLLSTLAGSGETFLIASEYDAAKKDEYMRIAKGIGDTLLDAIIVPEGEDFGIPVSMTIDTYENTIPSGMMPIQFMVNTDTNDTTSCTDGGTIKMQENRKTFMAQAVLFLTHLYEKTGESSYQRAAQIVTEGMLQLQECDGSYKDYTRWDGPGTFANVCVPDDGSPEYEAYPGNVALGDTRGFIVDTALLVYYLQHADPQIYANNLHVKTAVQFLLELEETDIGSGLSKNGDVVKHASYSLDTKTRAFAQIMLANVFLRSSCVENNESTQKRLQAEAYDLINKADTLIPSELDSKIANAIYSEPGHHLLAVSAAADSWKIITKGCQECTDGDGDGYIDGACAGDTVRYDCNDGDATIHPGASEVCDAVDNDCDGKVDNGFDNDGDGISTCAQPMDCNDENNETYPGAVEKVDDQDNDCDGKIDNAGIELQLLNDQNAGIPNIEIVFIDYGNACANSFSSLVGNIVKIKQECSTIGTCTTDSNGSCAVEIRQDGKYQALANIPGEGAASNPVNYQVGKKVAIQLQGKTPRADTNAATGESKPNPFTSNPYFLAGFLFVGLIIGIIVVAYLVKIGKLKLPKMGGGSPTNKTASKNEKDGKLAIKVESSKSATKSSMLVSPKMKFEKPNLPKVSAEGLASKIVSGKLFGNKEAKPANFPQKKFVDEKELNKSKKVWKDE